jgi:uncharacterized protein
MSRPTDAKPPAPALLLEDVVAERVSRRSMVVGVLGLPLVACAGRLAGRPGSEADARLGFPSISISTEDAVRLPPGYRYQVVNAWGDAVVAGAPPFTGDASESAAAQALQAGMAHDGMELFPLPRGGAAADHALLAINFEYTDDGLLHPGGMEPWTPEKVRKSMNAHGLGIIEVKLDDGRWRAVSGSTYGRRITVQTPIELRGPAAGHARMRTEADPQGRTVLGTLNNCASGKTPWGTYLSCEENVAPYFVNDSGQVSPSQDRIGVPTTKASWGFRWHEHEARFDAARHPNEPNRFGWVVELDPYDPRSVPVKRTALGRMAHEGATVTVARDGRVVIYMGDDDFRSKFEHVYKFVSARPWVRDGGVAGNRDLLDQGILHAARFHADGSGEWIPLVQGQRGLTAAAGFASQADVLIEARSAADLVGASYLDRPEWTALHPRTGEVYLSLTNNTARGKGKPLGAGALGPLGADGPNPRAPNLMGHIIRWREEGDDPAAARFRWDIFVQAGDPAHAEPDKRGDARGAVAFAQPDGLRFDERGVLWIATDSSSQNMSTADWKGIGHNQLLAADPATGEVRRFLTAPRGAEVTGVVFAPDLRTMFVNIQHPGEAPIAHPGRNDPARPTAHSRWPDGPKAARPRSATIAIRRDDGGIIGT